MCLCGLPSVPASCASLTAGEFVCAVGIAIAHFSTKDRPRQATRLDAGGRSLLVRCLYATVPMRVEVITNMRQSLVHSPHVLTAL